MSNALVEDNDGTHSPTITATVHMVLAQVMPVLTASAFGVTSSATGPLKFIKDGEMLRVLEK